MQRMPHLCRFQIRQTLGEMLLRQSPARPRSLYIHEKNHLLPLCSYTIRDVNNCQVCRESYNEAMDDVKKEKLKKKLSHDLYKIAVEKGTEAPFSGEYVSTKDKGVYKCMVCGNPLFSSETKFETKIPGLMGWPSFEEALPGSIKLEHDPSFGMNRTEVICAKCGSHLGHMFEDDSETDTGKHYCINSVCLNLKDKS